MALNEEMHMNSQKNQKHEDRSGKWKTMTMQMQIHDIK